MPGYILKTPSGQYQLSTTAQEKPIGGQIMDFLTKDVQIAGFNIPTWALIAAGVGIFLYMRRR